MSTSAPNQTVRDPKTRWLGTKPSDFLRHLRDTFAEAERTPKMERDRAMFKSDLFYRGKQRLFLSQTGYWKEIPANWQQPDLYHPENYFRVLLDGNVTQITQAQVEFEVRASTDSVKGRSAARAETSIASYYQRKFFTESFRQDLAKRVQIQGLVGVYCWWDDTAGPKVQKPQYAMVAAKDGSDAFQCPHCGTEGATEELLEGETCPMCGTPNPTVVEAPTVERAIQTGLIEYPAGDVCVEQVPGYELSVNSGARTTRVNGRTRYENLLYLERDRLVDRALMEQMFPDKWDKFESGGLDETQLRSNRYIQRIERMYGGTMNDRTGWGSDYSTRRVNLREVWFTPASIREYVSSVPQEIWEGGPMIEAGQSLADIYPNGVKVTMSGSTVLCCKDEDACKVWRFVKIRQMPDQFWGGDFADALPLQIILNETNSLILANGMNNEMPRALAYSPLIKNLDTYAYPGNVMTYELPPPEGITMADLFRQFPAQALAAPFYARANEIRTQMQGIFGGNFLGLSSESGGMKLDTATSWSVAQSQAAAKGKTMFALIAEGYAGILEVILDLFHDYGGEERTIELQGDYGLVESMAISGEKIGRDLEITVKPGSVVPRQDYQLRADVEESLGVIQKYITAYQAPPPPAIAELIADRYNVPPVASDAYIGARVAQSRMPGYQELAEMGPQMAQQQAMAQMEQMQAALPDDPESLSDEEAATVVMGQQQMQAQLIQQMQDPNAIAEMVFQQSQTDPQLFHLRLQLMTDRHVDMASWYEVWANRDEGLEASPVMMCLVQILIREHYAMNDIRAAQMEASKLRALQMVMPPPPEEDSGEKPKGNSPKHGATKSAQQDVRAAQAEAPAPAPSNF